MLQQQPSYPRNDNRPFWIYLIPNEGEAQRLTQSWADADLAAEFGTEEAQRRFNCGVEVVVIERKSNTAVLNVFI